MKKTAVGIIAFSVIFLLLLGTSCTNANLGGDATTQPATQQATSSVTETAATTTEAVVEKAAEPAVNMFGWEVPEETLVFEFLDTYSGTNMSVDKDRKNGELVKAFILENFNVDINKQSFDTDPIEKLNYMLASNDYPDVVSNIPGPELGKWISQGRAIELTEYYDRLGGNIQAELGDDISRYKEKDGKLFSLPTTYGAFPSPYICANLRYDWYLELGEPEFSTPEEYYEVLKKMVELHPTNENGEKVYALSFNELVKIGHQMGPWGIMLDDGYKMNDDNSLSHWLNTDEGLNACIWLNQVNLDGLYDPDAFINKYDDWKAKNVNNRFAGFLGPWWMTWNGGHEVWQTNDDWNPDQRFTQYMIKADSVPKSTMTGVSTFSDRYTIITDKCKDPENVFKFIDFNSSPLGLRLSGWGAPNLEESTWEIDDEGNWNFKKEAYDEAIAGTIDYEILEGKMGCRWFQLCKFSGEMRDGTGCVWNFNDNFVLLDPWKKLYCDNLADAYYDSSALAISFGADNILTPVKQQLDDSIQTGYAKIILSKSTDECIANFNQLKESMNASGLHDIEKYRTDSYREKLEAWGD